MRSFQMMSDNHYDRNADFWTTYLKGRPKIPDSFFDRVLDYHHHHGGEFGTLHDAGAGPGVHSKRLARHFEKIIVTDASEANIEVARTWLEPAEKFDFKVVKLEDTAYLASEGIDMVLAATMLHWTDVKRSMEAVAQQLRSGGTFVALHAGNPTLHDAVLQEKWLRVFHDGLCRYWEARKGPEKPLNALTITRSAYDAVPVAETSFLPGALRIKVNGADEGCEEMIPPRLRSEVARPSSVGTSDVILQELSEHWTFTATIDDLWSTLMSFGFTESGEYLELWRQLEEAVGDRRVEGSWPASIILATRR